MTIELTTQQLATYTSFGPLLRHLRKHAQLTQRQLGEQVGYSEAQMARLERNQRIPVLASVRNRFTKALGLTTQSPSAMRLIELAEAAHQTRTAQPADPPAVNIPTNLTPRPTPLVGRAAELAHLGSLLQDPAHRLITLVGTGGAGKTRLAIEVALQARFQLDQRVSQGVWFVDLSAIHQDAKKNNGMSRISLTSLIYTAIAQTLGQTCNTATPQPLIAYLRERQILLVLDNCEQVIATCAQVVEAITQDCPQLTVLATSREPLNIAGESVLRLPVLAPAAAQALFQQRASAADNRFSASEPISIALIAQICQQLDGLPLAIELAAAHLAAMSLSELAQHITSNQRLQVLADGRRSTRPRHQTLTSLIDWSHALLTRPEQMLFRRLAVFAGGFTLPAAQDICSGAGLPRKRVLPLLLRLVSQSLVVAHPSHNSLNVTPTRYTLLETLREYAANKLNKTNESQALSRRHLLFYFGCIKEVTQRDSMAASFVVIEADYNNIRAALAFGKRNLHRAPKLAEKCTLRSLIRFWYERGHWAEGVAWLSQLFIPCRVVPLERRANFQVDAAELLYQLGQFNAMLPRLNQADAWGRKCRNPMALVRAKWWLGTLIEDTQTAYAHLEEGIRRAESAGLHSMAGYMRIPLGLRALAAGDVPRALEAYDTCLNIGLQMNDPHNAPSAHLHKGLLYASLGQYDEAGEMLQMSYDLTLSTHNMPGQVAALCPLGWVRLCQKQLPQVRSVLHEAARLFAETQNVGNMADHLITAAGLALNQRQFKLSAHLLGAAGHHLKEARSGQSYPEWLPKGLPEIAVEQLTQRLQTHLSAASFLACTTHGAGWRMDAAVTEVLKLLEST